MSGYENVNDFIVILADDRDPDVSWQNHLDRGSLGGVDCVAPMRTPVYAPTDGRLDSAWLGTGGLTARIWQAGGWRDELMHMDEVLTARDVRAGDLIGYSGASGGDYSPHVHWHRVDPTGHRQNPWHYFTSSPAGSPGDLITPESEEDDMKNNSAFIYQRAADKQDVVFLANTDSGWWMEYISNDNIVPKGNNPVAVTLGTGAYARVSEAYVKAMKASLPRAQGAVVSGALTIAEADV